LDPKCDSGAERITTTFVENNVRLLVLTPLLEIEKYQKLYARQIIRLGAKQINAFTDRPLTL